MIRIICAVMITFISSVAISANLSTVKLATGTDYPPYTDKSLDRGGLFTALVEEIFKAVNIAPNLTWTNWKACYKRTTKNFFDGTFPYAKTPEREKEVLYSEKVLATDTIFITLEDETTDFEHPEKLTKADICKGKGYHSKDVEPYVKAGNLKLHWAIDFDNCLTMLEAKRTKALPISNLVASFQIRKMKDSGKLKKETKFKATKKPIYTDGLYFIVGKDNPKAKDLIKSFNEGLQIIKKNGTFDRLVKSYQI